jgi:microcystin-dependent protein
VEQLDLEMDDFIRFQCECIDQNYVEYLRTNLWPAETTQMCKDFIGCLKDEHSASARIVVGLARALGQQNSTGNGGGLFEVQSVEANGMVTPVTAPASVECFEPSNMSFASLVECQCMSDLIHSCGSSLVEDTVECLFDHACSVEKVCDHWKALNCPDNASQSVLQMRLGSEERDLLRQLFPATDKAMDGKQNDGVKTDEEKAALEALRVKKQNELVETDEEMAALEALRVRNQNEFVEIDEEMAALPVKEQNSSNRSSELPKPNHRLPASRDTSGSLSLLHQLAPRAHAKASTQKSDQIEGNNDRKQDLSVDSLDSTAEAKCTSD